MNKNSIATVKKMLAINERNLAIQASNAMKGIMTHRHVRVAGKEALQNVINFCAQEYLDSVVTR